MSSVPSNTLSTNATSPVRRVTPALSSAMGVRSPSRGERIPEILPEQRASAWSPPAEPQPLPDTPRTKKNTAPSPPAPIPSSPPGIGSHGLLATHGDTMPHTTFPGGMFQGLFSSSTHTTAGTDTGQAGSAGASAGGTGSGGSDTGHQGSASSVVQSPLKQPPRFREQGIAIGDAIDVQASSSMTFPLQLTLTYNPLEAQMKGIAPELIRPFFFDTQTGQWSNAGLTTKRIVVSDGLVEFETTHLTVFRLGVLREQSPLIDAIHPEQVHPGDPLVISGRRFSPLAAQNILTLGGAFVSVALDASGQPRPLDFQGTGETLILQDAHGIELDRAELSAVPDQHSSWTRQSEGDPHALFVDHAGVAAGRLFSPGTAASGAPFAYLQGTPSAPPASGELVINEVLLTPPESFLGDANGDGETDAQEDQFIELLNRTHHPLQLGGCTLLTRAGERHRFPAGTTLPGGMAMVLFGVRDAAHPPHPAGLFGGERFFPDTGTSEQLVAQIPDDVLPGAALLTATALRQTSNPVSVQILARLPEGHAATFEERAGQLPAELGEPIRFLRAADIDRDLDLDLVAVNASGQVVVLLNDGFGRFSLAAGGVALPQGVGHLFDLALTDLDGDGAPELVLGDTDAAGSYVRILVFGNDGAGAFHLVSSDGALSSSASAGPTTFGIGDVDDDGYPDVVVAMIGDRPLVFHNDGQGHWRHGPDTDRIPQVNVAVPTHLLFADLDRDGRPEVLITAAHAGLGHTPALQLFANHGQGQFEDVTAAHAPRNDEGIDAIAIGDVNGDGALDLVAGNHAGAVHLYLNDGAGLLTDATAGHLEATRASALALADINGDGYLDLIIGNAPADQLFLNDGTGVFAHSGGVPQTAGTHTELVPVDVDHDGDLDLFDAGPALHLLMNTGTTLNHPPHLEPIVEQIGSEGAPMQFEIRASDIDNDAVTLSMRLHSGEPLASLGATFTDHGDGRGTFHWTPSAGQGVSGGKHYELVARASDGIASDETSVPLLIHTLNHPPALEPIQPVTVEELTPVAFQLQASDPDAGDVLTFGVEGLPTGAALNSATGLFQWTPGPHAGDGPAGSHAYPMIFTVTDRLQTTASRNATVTVQDKNHAPLVTPIPLQQISEGQPLTFQVEAHDPDGDAVTFAAVDLPAGASFDTGTRQFNWTPSFLQGRAEPYIARFQVSDGSLTATLEVSIAVGQVNRPPRFVGLTDRTIEAGQLLQLVVEVEDLDGDPLTVSLIGDPPSGAVFDPASRQLTWTPESGQAGMHEITFQVSDGMEPVQQTVHITVQHVNHAPVLSALSDQTVREGELLQFALPVSDPDGDALTVTVTPLLPGAQVLHQGAPFMFQWVPGTTQRGAHALTVHVSDGAQEVTGMLTITVLRNPGLQRLAAQVGMASGPEPLTTPLGAFGEIEPGASTLTPLSLGADLGAVHPAHVSLVELFATSPVQLTEQEVQLFVSDDNVTYRPYQGSLVFSNLGRQITLSGVHIPERYLKVYLPTFTEWPNFLSEALRVSGAIPLDASTTALLDDLGHRTFQYFLEHVNSRGLIPDRVNIVNGQPNAGSVYTTAATGFWLASLPIAVERGWITRAQGEAFARQTIESFLGTHGAPVEGELGFFYHFLNDNGTRFAGFNGDGVSILDSTLLFLGALASGEYFDGEILTLATQLYDRADWEQFYDHDMHMLRLFRQPDGQFIRHLDYTSEGILAYLLAAGSTTHPVQPDPGLALGADAYYGFSRGRFGRVMGRFGRDGRPLLQSFFGSLFTYLYPSLWIDFGGTRDAFHINWDENAREAIVANFQFAQAHPEFHYDRLFWGISASDGPNGYQGLYGAPPLDLGAGGVVHDGTVTPYALAGSLPFAADLALPALDNLMTIQHGQLLDRYGLKDGININLQQPFFAPDYLGVDQGTLLLGLEQYRTGLVAQLVTQSPVLQRAFDALGFIPLSTAPELPLTEGPRSAHRYLPIDTTEHLTQTIQIPKPANLLTGDCLLELHPYGMDNALGKRFVDVDVALNGQLIKTVEFRDRRGDGVIDVGSVYVPINPSLLLTQQSNTLTLTWVRGERWVQLQEVRLDLPTGRRGSQEVWQIGQRDGAAQEFGDERLVNPSYLVGDDLRTMKRALNMVDVPITDLLFELTDLGVDRQLRLIAAETQNAKPVTIEVSVNDAVAGRVTLNPGADGTVTIPRLLLQEGWNHVALRHAAVPGDGDFIVWDALMLERQSGSDALMTLVRNVQDDQPAPEVHFGLAPSQGAVMGAEQYLEIHYQADAAFDRITISTDNRQAPTHPFTGGVTANASGLVGTVDSTVTAPLLWQVYDAPQPTPPAFTNTIEWAFVPDASEPGFASTPAMAFRTVVSRAGLGERPTPGRSGSSPIVVYLAADFRGKPAQPYATDRLLIERIEQ